MCFISYCIVEIGSDRANRSHTAWYRRAGCLVREYLPSVVTVDDRDVRRPGCARALARFNGDTTICTQRYTCRTAT